MFTGRIGRNEPVVLDVADRKPAYRAAFTTDNTASCRTSFDHIASFARIEKTLQEHVCGLTLTKLVFGELPQIADTDLPSSVNTDPRPVVENPN